MYCGHLMAFDENMMLRALTDAEAHDVAGNETILELQKIRGEVMEK